MVTVSTMEIVIFLLYGFELGPGALLKCNQKPFDLIRKTKKDREKDIDRGRTPKVKICSVTTTYHARFS